MPSQSDEKGTGIAMPITEAIEAVRANLRCAVRACGYFPHDDGLLTLLFFVLSLGAKE
jgi:hypothetical protein